MTSKLSCHHCNNEWEIKGKATTFSRAPAYPNPDAIKFVKVHSIVKKCMKCGRADGVYIVV